MKLTTHLHLVSRLKNEWNYSYISPVGFHGMDVDNFVTTAMLIDVCKDVCQPRD